MITTMTAKSIQIRLKLARAIMGKAWRTVVTLEGQQQQAKFSDSMPRRVKKDLPPQDPDDRYYREQDLR